MNLHAGRERIESDVTSLKSCFTCSWLDNPNCRAAIYVVPFQVLAHLPKNQPSLTHIDGAAVMEAMVKKYQQKLRKVRDEINRWDDLQSRLLSQFRNASFIIERLQVIQDSKNYGSLNCMDDIVNAVLTKQMESLEVILVSMKKTMEEFHGIVLSIEKIHRDSRQQTKGGSSKPSAKQLQQRVSIKPSLADCLDGLMVLCDMHHSEYRLKASVVSALLTLTFKPSASDLCALQQLLVDQPNIPRDEGMHRTQMIELQSIQRNI